MERIQTLHMTRWPFKVCPLPSWLPLWLPASHTHIPTREKSLRFLECSLSSLTSDPSHTLSPPLHILLFPKTCLPSISSCSPRLFTKISDSSNSPLFLQSPYSCIQHFFIIYMSHHQLWELNKVALSHYFPVNFTPSQSTSKHPVNSRAIELHRFLWQTTLCPLGNSSFSPVVTLENQSHWYKRDYVTVLIFGDSQRGNGMVQMVNHLLQCKRPGFNPWVRKILWRGKWQLTPVFLPG